MSAANTAKNHIRPHAKVWLERDGGVALSDWRVTLLEAIQQTGSLRAAAAALNVPYRTAWYKLRGMQQQLGVDLVQTASGGRGGGQTTLTPQATDIIRRFHRVSRGVDDMVRERFAAEFPELGS